MYSTEKQRNIWILLAILIWTGQLVGAQSRPASTAAVDLKAYGWEPPDRREHVIPSIAVDNEGRILVGFTVRTRGGLVTRSQPSLDFRIMRFLHDGKVDSSLSLPTHVKGTNGIYLSDTDQIIANANDTLHLLEAENGNLEQGVWRTLCAQWCSVLQSPTRHTLLLHVRDADPPVTIVRFLSEPVRQRCANAPQFIESDHGKIQIYPRFITDEFAYFYQPGPEGFTYRWPLCDYAHRIELPVPGPYRVLSDKIFVMQTSSSRIGSSDRIPEVISWDGQVKFRPAMLKDESSVGDDLKAIRSSARGDRIAVLMVTRRGGNLTLDISSHATALRIAVYDIETGKEVASIPLSLKHHYRFDFDLSPDGRRLAILEDEVVRAFDLEDAVKPNR